MTKRRGLIALLGALPLPLPLAAEPAPALSPALSGAQVLLFETPHLAALDPPVRLDYDFLRAAAGQAPVHDTIRLAVRAGEEPGRRDVAAEFLTGPRAIRYPTARGFRGNPLLLFALDRVSRELSAATGGAPDWFRNRIRRALAEAAPPRHLMLAFDGREIDAAEVTLHPFIGEPRAGRYQDQRYRFVLAEAVPGWIHTIFGELAEGAVREEITFAAAVPL
ncbi:hypothetical protein E2C06_05170 [Dankookia rubra]|uniref:Uncharacterized protein n=1 Tax=Dankookia rubra TaxID=1442381 RepID=A0A4R5QLH4_9PROT|nr:hypothetical protein [Dankookia rubra]TDH63718.1 hypothetical protein E2C06_05170 [Dankookia rubra]